MTMAQILGGDYGIDSSPVIPAGYGTMLAKAMGQHFQDNNQPLRGKSISASG